MGGRRQSGRRQHNGFLIQAGTNPRQKIGIGGLGASQALGAHHITDELVTLPALTRLGLLTPRAAGALNVALAGFVVGQCLGWRLDHGLVFHRHFGVADLGAVVVVALERCAFGCLGHSIGGRIAWTLAARHPERTERLVLVAPDGFASPGFEYGKPTEVPAVLGAMRYVMPKAVLRMNLAPAYADPAFLTDELTTRYHDLMLAPGGRDAMLKRLEQTVLTDPEPLLATIAAPTLLVWGEADAMIPVANAQDYLRALKNSRLVTFPAVGHLPQEEAAQASLGAVRDFLR